MDYPANSVKRAQEGKVHNFLIQCNSKELSARWRCRCKSTLLLLKMLVTHSLSSDIFSIVYVGKSSSHFLSFNVD